MEYISSILCQSKRQALQQQNGLDKKCVLTLHLSVQKQFHALLFPYILLEDQMLSDTHMIANGMHHCPWQHFERSSPERLLLALHAEHVQLLLLLLTEGLAIPHLGQMNGGLRVLALSNT